MSRRMTKHDVVQICREVFRDNPVYYRGDVTAQREYFNDFTDQLCKDSRITTQQYETWSNPF